jgi:hypothetical protein
LGLPWLEKYANLASGWLEQAGFIAMTLRPTDDQLKTLQSVEQAIAGIDAVPNKEAGFDCVVYGWLKHRAHRRDDGGLIDVWRLTEEGRRVLRSTARRPQVKAANGSMPQKAHDLRQV